MSDARSPDLSERDGGKADHAVIEDQALRPQKEPLSLIRRLVTPGREFTAGRERERRKRAETG